MTTIHPLASAISSATLGSSSGAADLSRPSPATTSLGLLDSSVKSSREGAVSSEQLLLAAPMHSLARPIEWGGSAEKSSAVNRAPAGAASPSVGSSSTPSLCICPPPSTSAGSRIATAIFQVVQQAIDGLIERIARSAEQLVTDLFSTSWFGQSVSYAPVSGAAGGRLTPGQNELALASSASSGSALEELLRDNENAHAGAPAHAALMSETVQNIGARRSAQTVEIRPSAENVGLSLVAEGDSPYRFSLVDITGPAGATAAPVLSQPFIPPQLTGQRGQGSSSAVQNGIAQLFSHLDPMGMIKDSIAAIGAGVDWIKDHADLIISTVASALPWGKLRGALGVGVKQLKKLF